MAKFNLPLQQFEPLEIETSYECSTIDVLSIDTTVDELMPLTVTFALKIAFPESVFQKLIWFFFIFVSKIEGVDESQQLVYSYHSRGYK